MKKPTLKTKEEIFDFHWNLSTGKIADDTDRRHMTWVLNAMEEFATQKNVVKKPKLEIPMERIIEFNEIFPKRTGGSGKALRCNLRELEKAFQWFFKNYDYDWETIFTATERYVQDQTKEDFKFCRTSKYFIVKFKTPTMPESALAEYAVQVLEGDYFEGDSSQKGFEPKVY